MKDKDKPITEMCRCAYVMSFASSLRQMKKKLQHVSLQVSFGNAEDVCTSCSSLS